MYYLTQDSVILTCNESLDRIKYIKESKQRYLPHIKYQIKTLQELIDHA